MTTKWIGHENSNFAVGDVGFLIRKIHTTKGWETYDLREHPGKTNVSFEAKLHGWLGSTNDVSTTACGVCRVTRVAKNGRAQVVELTGDDLATALDDLGYPDLA